ncbi:uncharacterized protein LOC110467003 isoform X1 [Mizuhopecten yessoensis]|uniref:uncharacterized protein LOC110467003 isoform X1 n=1 Tax=Mizuhopecten yessoensis TaxID=6573 RepID=UPI000B45CFEF|nr:uncharacterized protein LOC110467003 isoform X1 [Mizuhopecten yessoensis]
MYHQIKREENGKAIRSVVKEINDKIIDMTNTKDHGVLSDYGFGHHNSFFCQLQGNTILITLKLQVVPLLGKTHLYQVMVYPVPTTKQSRHATKIAGLPEYVIISDDYGGRRYSPITPVQLSNCRGIHHVVCPFNLVYTTVLKENCLTSLIKDSSDKIAKFCDFRYFRDHLEPSIEPISDNSFSVYDIPRLSLNIRGHTEDVEGCHLCIITIPCHARIETYDMTSDRVLSQKCNSEETEVTRDHLVNLAMVKAFIAENNQLGFTASSVFSKAQDVKVPKFDFFEHRYHEFLTTDQKTNLKLNKMVEASKRQEKIFQNIAEPFIKASEENATWLTSSLSVGDIVVIICLIVGTVVFIRLIFIVKRLGAIIAVSTKGEEA